MVRSTGPARAVVDRRSVLAAAGGLALVGLAGCTSNGSPAPTPSASTSTLADADRQLRTTVAQEESELAARYQAARATYPQLADRLAVGDRHVLYAAALAESTATATPATSRPARTPAAALRDLAKAERAAAATRLGQCARARDPELVRQLALIGAGCAAAAQELDSDE